MGGRCLEALGHEIVVADPNFAPMYATRKVKTDRRDARALAEACLLGAYRPAHWLSDAQRHVRARLTIRDTLVRTRTRYISLNRALLRQHGWQVPTGSAEGFPVGCWRCPCPGGCAPRARGSPSWPSHAGSPASSSRSCVMGRSTSRAGVPPRTVPQPVAA